MPPRSTPFQAIVRLVREHFAGPDVTVTESKMLRDSILGVDREVDIVLEGRFEGEPITISIEVVEHGRKAGLPWVEQMMAKHKNLPTNRLLLVSKSGFARTALAAVEMQSGRVVALQPVVDDSTAVVTQLYLDIVQYGPIRCTVHALTRIGEIASFEGSADTGIYDSDGDLRGTLAELSSEAVGIKALGDWFLQAAQNHPERDEVTHFSAGVALGQLGFHVRHEPSGELHTILAIEPVGRFSFQQHAVPLTRTRLGDLVFGSAEVSMGDRSTVLVGTETEDSGRVPRDVKVSILETAAKRPTRHEPQEEKKFPELLQLPLPEESAGTPEARHSWRETLQAARRHTISDSASLADVPPEDSI